MDAAPQRPSSDELEGRSIPELRTLAQSMMAQTEKGLEAGFGASILDKLALPLLYHRAKRYEGAVEHLKRAKDFFNQAEGSKLEASQRVAYKASYFAAWDSLDATVQETGKGSSLYVLPAELVGMAAGELADAAAPLLTGAAAVGLLL